MLAGYAVDRGGKLKGDQLGGGRHPVFHTSPYEKEQACQSEHDVAFTTLHLVDDFQPGTTLKPVHHLVHSVVVFGFEFFSGGKVEAAGSVGQSGGSFDVVPGQQHKGFAILQPLDPNSAIVVDAAYGVNLG